MRSENFVMGMIITCSMFNHREKWMVMRKVGKSDGYTDDTRWLVIRQLDRVEDEFSQNHMEQEGSYAEFSKCTVVSLPTKEVYERFKHCDIRGGR